MQTQAQSGDLPATPGGGQTRLPPPHQRFAPATICVYMVGDPRADDLRPGSDLDRLYGLSPRMKPVEDPRDPACAEVLCYCSQQRCRQVDLEAFGYTPQPMFNTVEMSCGRKRAGVG